VQIHRSAAAAAAAARGQVTGHLQTDRQQALEAGRKAPLDQFCKHTAVHKIIVGNCTTQGGSNTSFYC
jgi:hypothetical protein